MSKKLVSFRLDENTEDLIEELKEKLNLETNTETIVKAVHLLDAVGKNQANGGSLVLRRKGKSDREVVFL